MRRVVLVLLSLVLCGVVWWLWPRADHTAPVAKSAAAPATVVAQVGPAAPVVATNAASVTSAPVGRSAASTNREAFRLANTSKKIGELTSLPHAILLENALVDTDAKLTLKIPAHLKATAEPGAFIVQSRGPVTAAFRAVLASAGAQIISYIPNNAYLVQLSGAGAGMLAGNPQVQAVLPYEPYYKVQSSLLGRAVEQQPLEKGQILTLGLFSTGVASTVAQIEKLGGRVIATDRSPFGPVVRVQPPSDWLALAQLPGVMRVEPATHRQLANDLARVTMGITTNYYATNANWLNLYGSNVLVEVNDSGIDASHPDFSANRVTGYSANSTVDTDGHGTHVAGIIAGNGTQSIAFPIFPSGSVSNADMRGKASLAKLYAVGIFGSETNVTINDSFLQEQAALTNALISNNSWSYGVNEYDLSAASFDAAVRDALPEDTGPQPVLFVFAAGNDGAGDATGINGEADSIESPATAKNVVTVGALEQSRDITNEVTSLNGTTNAVWADQTDSSVQVANYSARGNVGIQTEGTYGRFKPDVVAPGSFVVSTRSQQWDKAAYYNPTNVHSQYSKHGLVVSPGLVVHGNGTVQPNAVGLIIQVQANRLSPSPFPTNFPIYIATSGLASPTNFDYATSNNILSIPPGGGTLTSIAPLLNNSFSCAVGNPTNFAINFDLIIQVLSTNDDGNKLTVLSNLNETIGPWYRYESGTSMAAPAASGSLALMQEFFASHRAPGLATNPSPALLKAMLINGSRLTSVYSTFAVTNSINYEGWGLVNVPNSLPSALTNASPGVSNGVPMFILDQSPTNALATGDSRTFSVVVPTAKARAQALRFTLAWTDPPGNPAAAIKLVNNLDLIVTNLDTGRVYYGNMFGSGATSVSANSNSVPDTINNVENIWLASAATNYSVTVLGRNVAVNAVTAEQTNIVQDFALVISTGSSTTTNGILITSVTPPAPTVTAPPVTFISNFTNGIYFSQLAGANAPWLSTNGIAFGTNSAYATNVALFIGQTNQWHFFVVTNTTTFTNAAFIIFLPETQATPRMGVFADSSENPTRPEADLNLFVASAPDPNAVLLTNLDQTVISNCVFNANGDQASLARGGTKFIAYSNSVGQQVYYIGVQCQDQMAANFGFLSVFSQNPFSSLNPDGSQTVNGLLLPAAIPDGSPSHGGVGYCVALALYPMAVGGLTVTNTITHQFYGDLIGALSHNNASVVLNSHDGSVGNVVNYITIYNDSGQPGTVGTDGPGSLHNFTGKEAVGPWFLTEVDDALSATGSITGFTMNIQPHKDLTQHPFQTVTVPAQGWFYGYVDVPVGFTNLTLVGTNVTNPTAPQPIQMYLNTNGEPTFTSYLVRADLTNAGPTGLGNSISYGPPLQPGRYFVGLYNPNFIDQLVLVGVTLAFNAAAIANDQFDSIGTVALTDDAVSYSHIDVDETNLIQEFSVGLRVDHPRISDLTFTLISPPPASTRYLLMENRGGQSTNGAGVTIITTNIIDVSASGGPEAKTNFINVGISSGTFPITYNFYTVPDQMTVYYGTNVIPANLIFDTGMTNGQGTIFVDFPPAGVSANSTYLTIVMNQFTNAGPTAWTYTAGGVLTNNYYLTFTEDTNLTTTPIKYAVPPLVPATNFQAVIATNSAFVWSGSFEGGTNNYSVSAGNYFPEGWFVNSGDVDVFSNGTFGATAYDGGYFIDLNGNGPGSISTNIPTVVGGNYILTFAYTREPDTIPLGVFPEAQLSINGSNTLVVAPALTNSWTSLDWATTSVVFTATSSSTAIQMDSLTPGLSGVLLDDFSLQQISVVTNLIPVQNNLYYFPEDDISGLIGTPANGTGRPGDIGRWTLEILDNRAGATNNAQLVSWQLNITVANTNFTTGINTNLGNGAITNFIPGGGFQWYAVIVPTNADWATNSLLFATLPLNMWWSTNFPPSFTNGSDAQLLGSSVGGVSVLGTNTVPAFIIPGGIYFLGIQNTNVGGATYALEVDFHLLPVAPSVITQPATDVTFTTATLQALVSPNFTDTTVYFQYGPDTNTYSNSLSATLLLTTNLNLQQLVGIDVTNLTPNTLYHFRAVATNSQGISYGADLTFVSTPLPYSASVPATLLNGASAQLNGFASPNGTQAYAWFEFGTSSTYGVRTPVVDVGSNSTVVFVTNQIPSGLITNLAYHFRLVVSNSVGVAYGFDQIFDQGNVVAWGANYVGQATVPSGLTNLAVGIAAGYENGLAMNNNGGVVAWGINTFNQTNVPPELTNAVGVGGGDRQSLALRSDRTVLVWGSNQFKQTNVPPNLTNAVGAASGGIHCLALRDNGRVVAWGFNGSGQTNVPVGLTNVVAIAGGELHSLALKNDGTVVAWGYNGDGETNVPAGLRNVVAIAAGGYHNLALKGDGTVVAWGDDQDTQVSGMPPGLTNVIAIAGGGFHSLALKSDGSVVGWGDNGSLQITMPTNLNNVVAIAGGGLHSIALTSLFGLNQTNNAPFWTNGLNNSTITMNALTTLVVTNTATDTNFPTQTLTYSLLTGPSWAGIDNLTGRISLSPLLTNSPSTNLITTKVLDNGFPALSATNTFTVIVLPPINLTNGVPQTNSVIGGGVNFYLVNVPTNADFATNRLLSATPGILNVWFSTNAPPSVGSLGDVELLTNVTSGSAVINTNVAPLLVPGLFYWLGVQNTNSFTVTYNLEVDFHPPAVTTPPAPVAISSIIYTNIAGSPGFLLTWFAPSNDLFQVQFTDTLAPLNWITFTNPPVTGYNTNFPANATNAQFNFFDDGSQAPFGPTRFYRLNLLNGASLANTLTLPPQTNFTTSVSPITVTNTATDSNTNALLTYSLLSSPPNASISTNGIITWTNATPAGLAARFTTLVTDNGTPPASTTNSFTVFVLPFPSISAVSVTATNESLSWLAPTNDQFQVRWSTNLVTWTSFPQILTFTNGGFSFTDTNAPLLMKFYQLILLP